MPKTETTIRKNIDIEREILEGAYRIARKERRRGEPDPKNLF